MEREACGHATISTSPVENAEVDAEPPCFASDVVQTTEITPNPRREGMRTHVVYMPGLIITRGRVRFGTK